MQINKELKVMKVKKIAVLLVASIISSFLQIPSFAASDYAGIIFGENKTQNKIHDSQGFFDIFIIFMAVVVKSNLFTVIFVNKGGCNYRSAKITANIFDNGTWIAPVGLGINIEAFPVLTITQRFDFFKR